MNAHLSTLFATSLCGAALAQQTETVPVESLLGDLNGKVAIAGFNNAGRQQILLNASTLTNVAGSSITRVSFRRDASHTDALEGGTANLTITMSPAPVSPRHAAAAFEENLDVPGNRVQVFSGLVTLPPSPDASVRTVMWGTPSDVVHIDLSTPYAYGGGHLCIDIVGAPAAGNESGYWVPDGIVEINHGSVATVGHSCHPFGGASVPTKSLVPGTSSRFVGYGEAGAIGSLFIGTPSAAIDLSLFGLSTANCELYTIPFVALPVTFQPLPFAMDTANVGIARFDVKFSANPGSLGFAFRAQFASLTTTIETTEALDCVLASTLPDDQSAYVYAPSTGASVGAVHTNKAPAVQFTYQ